MGKRKIIERTFLWFLYFSIVGWLYEVFLEVVVYRWGFSNRGVLFGPYCIIYGFGALIIIFSLSPILKRKPTFKWFTPIIVLFAGGAIATVIELVASYILEFFAGGWAWDYTRYAIQFQGRIALNPSFRFALGSLLFIYVLLPIIEKLLNYLGEKNIHRLYVVLLSLFLIDVAIHIIKLKALV